MTPLLKDLHEPYRLTALIESINHLRHEISSFEYVISAYLDDTKLISTDTSCLGRKLSIASSFYRFNNVQVNDDKTRLITNVNLHGRNSIPILINGKRHELLVTSRSESVRFLGIWININGNRKYTVEKMFSKVD